MNVDFPKDRVDVTLLRPQEANVIQRVLLEMISVQKQPEQFSRLIDCNNAWDLDLAGKKQEALRALIEDAADSIGVSVHIQECQLRRREQRDCYTNDLGPALSAIDASHVTIIRNPSFAQVRHFRSWVRNTLFQRLVVLTARERMDDLLEDFGNSFYTSYATLGKGPAQERKQPRIFLADDCNDSRVEAALRNALDFSNLNN